ncbi:uncharacterized protein TNCV_3519261 [Trichonephila clavipes]|uniref:Uncharacterized protein n=1 Tax=Trichonephila clavipes TaxID=2585209 RepID=A0A8X6T098_TRICX|nr:uncharacterized protein TNCV_3519261 [Trichonephila clavipes]
MTNFEEGEHPAGGSGSYKLSSSSTILTRTLVARWIFRVPHSPKALYIKKHPCLLRDSNPGPTAQQSASLTTIPDGRHILGGVDWDFYVLWKLFSLIRLMAVVTIVLESKPEEFVDDALIYAKSLFEELEISFEPPRRIRRKQIFGDGSKDVQLSYEDDLRRIMFSSLDRVTAEIREKVQQLQYLTKICFLRPEVILSTGELNLDQTPQDINKDKFQFQSVRLQAFVATTAPDFKNDSLGPAVWVC